MKMRTTAVSIGTALAMLFAAAGAAAADATDYLGEWRLTRAVAAPWAQEGQAAIERAWIGRNMTFRADKMKGPGPLACAAASYKATSNPPEGLFQGGLPAPAEPAAQSLGLTQFPVFGFSLSCDTGVFEFHQAGPNALLFALDNVVWTLDRSPGARTPVMSPAGVVQRFLEAHFNGDMGFDEATVAEKQAFLSRRLRRRIKDYFATTFPADEVPPIDGDPFTDSQEYPTRFSVSKGELRSNDATAPVLFSDGFRDRLVVYRLIGEQDKWRIDDLEFEDGGTLSDLLE